MQDDLHSATATGGGPISGQEMTFACDKGVLVVDKIGRKAWVYDYDGSSLVCRDAAGDELDDAGRYKAADEMNYTVVAVASETQSEALA